MVPSRRADESTSEQAAELERARKSVAPHVLRRRRLEERYCAAEARCVADAVREHKELVYGTTFEQSLMPTAHRTPWRVFRAEYLLLIR